MKNKLEEKFTMYLRAKMYEKCRILVNDMAPVIKEINLFVKEILLSPGEDEVKTLRISKSIDLTIERKNGIVGHSWSICTGQLLDHPIIDIELGDINEMYKEEYKDFKKTLKDEGIEQFPKDLYGKAFVCFIEAISDTVFAQEINEETDIYGLLKLNHNGENNIVY